MTDLFTKKAYEPSVSSFQVTVLCTLTSVFSMIVYYIDCNVLNDSLLLRTAIFTLTDYFK